MPFSTGWLAAWDTLRAFVILGGLVDAVLCLWLIAKTDLASRMALTVGLLGFLTASVGTEIEHLGDHATYRLFFNIIGTAAAGVGMWLARQEDRASPRS